MKKILFLTAFIAATVWAFNSYAQSTATQVQLGYLAICSNGFVCWSPYTSANPLPVILTVTTP